MKGAIYQEEISILSAYIKRSRPLQTSSIMMYLKLLEKEEQTKPTTSRWREIIKIRAKISETEAIQTMQSINERKSYFFLKRLIDKP
jgi:hypothetical protein